MEEELKELAAAYVAAAKGLAKKWPKIEDVAMRDYPKAVSDLATAAALEMAANDILKILIRHADDGR